MPLGKPFRFADLLKQMDTLHDDLQFVRQLKKLDIIMSGGDMRRIQRAPGGENAIIDFRDMASGISQVILPQVASYDPETVTWINRAEAIGGTFLPNSKTIADNFIVALHAKSYNSKVVYLLPLLGANLGTARIPLRDSLNVGAAGISGFIESDFSQLAGLQGNGLQKYFDTLIKPSQLHPSRNAGFGVWARDIGQSGASKDWVLASNGSFLGGGIYGLNLTTTHELFYFGDDYNPSVNAASAGLYYGQRSSATDRRLYRNGAQVTVSAVNDPANGVAGRNIWFMGIEGAPGVDVFWAGRAGLAYLTDGTLTADEIADFNQLLNDLLISPRSVGTEGQTFPTPDPDTPGTGSAFDVSKIVVADDRVVCTDDEVVTIE